MQSRTDLTVNVSQRGFATNKSTPPITLADAPLTASGMNAGAFDAAMMEDATLLASRGQKATTGKVAPNGITNQVWGMCCNGFASEAVTFRE